MAGLCPNIGKGSFSVGGRQGCFRFNRMSGIPGSPQQMGCQLLLTKSGCEYANMTKMLNGKGLQKR